MIAVATQWRVAGIDVDPDVIVDRFDSFIGGTCLKTRRFQFNFYHPFPLARLNWPAVESTFDWGES